MLKARATLASPGGLRLRAAAHVPCAFDNGGGLFFTSLDPDVEGLLPTATPGRRCDAIGAVLVPHHVGLACTVLFRRRMSKETC